MREVTREEVNYTNIDFNERGCAKLIAGLVKNVYNGSSNPLLVLGHWTKKKGKQGELKFYKKYIDYLDKKIAMWKRDTFILQWFDECFGYDPEVIRRKILEHLTNLRIEYRFKINTLRSF